MTDEELKKKLLMFQKRVRSAWRNPEGPQAVARIEELEAALYLLYGQVDQARDCWIYPDSPSMDAAMLNAREALEGANNND